MDDCSVVRSIGCSAVRSNCTFSHKILLIGCSVVISDCMSGGLVNFSLAKLLYFRDFALCLHIKVLYTF